MPKKSSSVTHKKTRVTATRPDIERPRKLKHSGYRSFRLSKRIKHPGRPLPSAWRLTVRSCSLLWQHKKLFFGVLFVHAVLQLLLVQGALGGNFTEASRIIEDSVGDQWNGLAGGIALFSYLVGSTGQTDTAEANVYQSFLLLLVSLAMIWALRQVLAGHTVRIRDAYYKGMYPLVPFILVLLVVLLQMIPLLIGVWMYQTVVANGIAVSWIEHAFWIVTLGLFATLSVYMICSSLFALYIATLPDMTPMKALRSARELVLYRRWSVVRKFLFLLFVLFMSFALVLIPVIVLYAPAAPIIFYVLTIVTVGFVHTYLYSLYRELLHDE